MALFNAILRTYLPPVCKQARVISVLKPGKDPALPRPVSILDTIRNVFENILLNSILSEISGRGLLRDEHFGFRPRQHILAAGPLRWKRIQAYETVWVDGLAYKLIALNFPSYLVKTIQSYLRGRTFEASLQSATSSRRGMVQGGLISPVLFSLYVNDMPVPSQYVELALCADDTAVIATSRKPTLLVSYLEACHVSKSCSRSYHHTHVNIRNRHTKVLYQQVINSVDDWIPPRPALHISHLLPLNIRDIFPCQRSVLPSHVPYFC